MARFLGNASTSANMVAYSWIADQREKHKKINFLTSQKGYDNSETTVGKLSARRIQIFQVPFSMVIF